MKKLVLAALFCLLCCQFVASQMIVNEALVNEPGGAVKGEWIELYNADSVGRALDNFTLAVNGAELTIPTGRFVDGDAYLVLVRDSVTFEARWGDSSGVWGDNLPLEGYLIQELPLQLVNSAGSALLISPAFDSSLLVWLAGGSDGISWERTQRQLDTASASFAAGGATPGARNSRTPLNANAALSDPTVSRDSLGFATVRALLSNIGAEPIPRDVIYAIANPSIDSVGFPPLRGDTLAQAGAPPLAPGDSAFVTVRVKLPGYYTPIGLFHGAVDDDPSDNFVTVIAPGELFSPVVINEFLANPTPELGAEWVELKNVSDTTIAVSEWWLGDALGVSSISVAPLFLAPADYIVITQDRSAFLSFYADFTGVVEELSPWRSLNNDFDQVRLFDQSQILADSMRYQGVYSDNVTRARVEAAFGPGDWGRSRNPGGSPGAPNDALFSPTGTTLTLSVSPDPFSPDGDGVDDLVNIEVSGVTGGTMRLTIYDSQGGPVRTLFDGEPFSGAVIWDGTSDSGARAQIGLYILYIEVDGKSAKSTVVVAR